ncbi:MAG TPA: ABC transporter ATP-binding protein [Dehalococcoidia bacterium]|nr:ABC transporter ATP-binding protein [Dehalococcoidia bacterium]
MLEIKGLRVSYGRDVVLDGIDLELAAGETLAIVGESGTGKTTLGLSIMRLVEGTIRGTINFNGKDLLALSDQEIRQIRWTQIAMAFQNANNVLNPVYTVLDQIAEPVIEHGLSKRNEARDKAAALLNQFGLRQNRFAAYPHQLSGGEQQRVLLAMAMANDPELLILDEPLSSLDAATRTEIGDLLKQTNTHRTKLVVTHDLDTVSKLADRLAVLYGGKIIEVGPTQDILTHPRHPYTRALIRAYPNMTTVKDLQGIKGRMTRPVSGCSFHPRCTQAIDICSRETPELLPSYGRNIACHRGGIITLLSTRNLTKSFGSLKAVDSANLNIEGGETLALVGQTGSGKTTLAKMIVGLHQPTEGAVYLEDVKVDDRGKDFYKKVQMVFQNPGESLSHRLSVLEAVTEPLEIQETGAKEERINKAIHVLGEVELPQTVDFLNKYPHHLSGGEMQRVAIARALVLDPALLIADEPTAFLDASIQAKILKLLLNLQEQRGLSMLYITHDIAAARKVSDRIAVMLDGKIVEEGPSNEIVTAPKHAYTENLLNSAPTLHLTESR